MPFHTRADLEVYRDNLWVVTQPLIWSNPKFDVITVPKGFVTDLASTPQIMHAIPWFDPAREGRAGAIVHDFLYCSHRHSWTDSADHVYEHAQSRLWCDSVLRTALIDCGVSPSVAYAYFAGVRMGGWVYWGQRGDGLNQDDFVPEKYWLVEGN